jgi:hypothetical protein
VPVFTTVSPYVPGAWEGGTPNQWLKNHNFGSPEWEHLDAHDILMHMVHILNLIYEF